MSPGQTWTSLTCSPELAKWFERALVAIMVPLPGERIPSYIGTATLISVHDGWAAAITATHLFDEVRRHLRLRECEDPEWQTREHLRRRVWELVRAALRDGIVLLHVGAVPQTFSARVEFVHGSGKSDVAILLIESPLLKAGMPCMAIDAVGNLPPVTNVMAVSLWRSSNREATSEERAKVVAENPALADRDSVQIFHQQIDLRGGYILSQEAQTQYTLGPGYRVSFPIPHGMSGSPVILLPEDTQGRAFIIAICSHCESTKAVRDDENYPGRGFVSSTVNALPLNVTPTQTLLECIKLGAISDRGPA